MNEKLKSKIKAKVKQLKQKRKQLAGKPNIENISTPKKQHAKHVKESKVQVKQPGSVSIGAKGGRYVQEASGHKRYLKEGSLSGTKKLKKSLEVKSMLNTIVLHGKILDFIDKWKRK